MLSDDLGPIDLDALRYEPLAGRPSKVTIEDLGRPLGPKASLADLLGSLPRPLAGSGLRRLRDSIVLARTCGKPVAAAIGGHVIKTGCGPYLVDWIDRRVLNALAMNGSAAIHDLELAVAGHTSEDVGPRLMEGTFGFARETSDLFARACAIALASGCGLGSALGRVVVEHGGPGLDSSVLVAAYRRKVPLTVHVAVGTDIVHMTGKLDGAALGRATLDDFRTLTEVVARMSGGVWLNIGSAVVLPEVFLKAVAIVRNLGRPLDGLTTANLDFQQQYRGLLNVLQRPGAEGIALTGHHEIMIPLLHAAVLERLEAAPHSALPHFDLAGRTVPR
ncbi:hypothetical protein EP7_004983 [Isosphaeraceae bacterium EP7]